MENRKSRELSRQSLTGKPIKRDKDYYLNNMDVESALHKTAVSMAERMFAAFVREKNIQVSVNIDDLADKIISKMVSKGVGAFPVNNVTYPETPKQNTFNYDDDEPVIIKTDKVEIKGSLAKAKQSEESISDNLDALKDLEL